MVVLYDGLTRAFLQRLLFIVDCKVIESAMPEGFVIFMELFFNCQPKYAKRW